MRTVWMPTMVPFHHPHYIFRQPYDLHLVRLRQQQQQQIDMDIECLRQLLEIDMDLECLQQQQIDMDRSPREKDNLLGIGRLTFTWTFPGSNDVLKLNTDGSSKGNPGPSSFGGLIRDNNGRWLCGYMGKIKGKYCTSLEAEAWSVYKGLCLIKEKKLSCVTVMVETDCQAILTHRVVGNANNYSKLDDRVELIFSAIDKMMKELRCYLVHTRRDGNHCADKLAKLGGTQKEEYIVLKEPPSVLVPYLKCDIEAAIKC